MSEARWVLCAFLKALRTDSGGVSGSSCGLLSAILGRPGRQLEAQEDAKTVQDASKKAPRELNNSNSSQEVTENDALELCVSSPR